jgi:uroporphyrinogen decarboxylase
MGRKADMLAALDRRVPSGAVPLWEIEFQAWDAISGKHLVLGREFEQLSAAAQERALHVNAEILLAVSQEMEYAALSVPNAYWDKAPGQLAYYVLPGDVRYRQAEIIRALAPADLLLVGNSGGVLAANYAMEFCVRMVEAPESIDDQARGTLARGIDAARRFRDCGVEAVVTASDIADNAGPFFNPAQMERWIYPALREWSAAVRALGLRSILHSDGNLTRCLDGIAATGVDALQAVDPTAGMEMSRAQEQVAGRLCLCGNMDCGLLLRGTPADVFEATRRLLVVCKARGGLVLGASNAVQEDVPLANYRAMIEAWRQYGRYDH